MKPVLAVLVGGLVGTGLRLGVDAVVPHVAGTLAVNILGSFILGLLVARLWPVASDWLRAGLGAGLLGSFTTFSAVAVAAVDLTVAGSGLVGVGYVAASVLGGVVAAFIGLRTRRPRQIGADE